MILRPGAKTKKQSEAKEVEEHVGIHREEEEVPASNMEQNNLCIILVYLLFIDSFFLCRVYAYVCVFKQT